LKTWNPHVKMKSTHLWFPMISCLLQFDKSSLPGNLSKCPSQAFWRKNT
jgi:hypothetical protein